eukprot:jgi/Botrbrau1/8108/Bobra.0308s0003.1
MICNGLFLQEMPLFGRHSRLRQLENLPISPNYFSEGDESKMPATVIGGAACLPPSRTKLSICVKTTSPDLLALKNEAMDLRTVTSRLSRLEDLSVKASCFFTEVLFDPDRVPALRHFRVSGANIAKGELNHLHLLDSAAWSPALSSLPGRGGSRQCSGAGSIPFAVGTPQHNFLPAMIAEDAEEGGQYLPGNVGVPRGFVCLPACGLSSPHLWMSVAKEISVTTIICDGGPNRPCCVRGLGAPSSYMLQHICRGHSPKLELIFQCHERYEGGQQPLVDKWVDKSRQLPVFTCHWSELPAFLRWCLHGTAPRPSSLSHVVPPIPGPEREGGGGGAETGIWWEGERRGWVILMHVDVFVG